MAEGVRVEGLQELIRDMQRLGVDVEDMKSTMGGIAARAATFAESFAPKRSGALAASVRGNKAKNKAVITAGRGKTNQYARIINFGWPARGIQASMFMQRADRAMAPLVVPMLSDGIDKLIAARGLK